MKEIKLTQGKVALVDDADFDWLNQWKWHAFKCYDSEVWYAKRTLRISNTNRKIFKSIRMHALISQRMGFSRPDHKDRNGLNNQRSNLRPASASQNCANRSCFRNNKCGFKGVCMHKQSSKWRASIYKDGKRESLGLFQTALEAALVYDRRAKELFGEFAVLNFPIS